MPWSAARPQQTLPQGLVYIIRGFTNLRCLLSGLGIEAIAFFLSVLSSQAFRAALLSRPFLAALSKKAFRVLSYFVVFFDAPLAVALPLPWPWLWALLALASALALALTFATGHGGDKR